MNGPSGATLDKVWHRAASRCERCGDQLERNGGGYSVHHRRLKGMGGDRRQETHEPSNLLLLCGDGVLGCHGVVHHNREEAEREGFIISRWAEPTRVPVASWVTGWVLLDNTGGMIRCGTNPL